MPALKLFGRKWLAATDDLVFPCLLELIVRVVWIILMGVVTYRYYNCTFTCPTGGELVRIYLIGMLVFLGLNIVLLIAIINRSAQGGICDIQARKLVPPLLGVKILLLLPEAGWNVIGTAWAFTSFIDCPAGDPFVNITIDVLVCLNWVIFVLLIFVLAMFIDPIGPIKLRASQTDLSYDTLKDRKVTRTWVRRFRWIFCYWFDSFRDSLEAFAEIAGLISWLFRDSDIVLSDLIAGCILLRVKQEQESQEQWRVEERLKYTSDLRDVFRDKPKWMKMEYAAHYMQLSMAVYGCVFVLYHHYCTGICRLLRHITCCACFRRKKFVVVGDTCCRCNMAGFKALSNISEDEVVYANFKNRIFKVPFCVITDHRTKSVIVVVRGTISVSDAFTDLVGTSEEIEAEGLPQGSIAHKGMLRTAKKLKQHLDEIKILEKAFSSYPNYNLIFTGHSLGAATAVLLGIFYRPTYPELKVYAFSTPCVLTKAAAVYCESFVFTVGVGDDFVMRLGTETLDKFRTQLFEVLQNCRLPKYRVILNGLRYALCGVPAGHLNTMWKENRPVQHHSESLPAHNAIHHIFAAVSKRKLNKAQLYPAGQILHIAYKKKNKEERSICHCFTRLFCCCKKRKTGEKTYEMRWVGPEFFDELKVMPRMLYDHMPENVTKATKTILDEQETEIEEM